MWCWVIATERILRGRGMGEQGESAPRPARIAWRTGFIRLWIALTVAWILVMGGWAYQDTSIPSLTKSCSMLRDFEHDGTKQKLGDKEVRQCEAVWVEDRNRLLAITFGPPLVLLLLGATFAWIRRG